MMLILRTIADVTEQVGRWRAEGRSVGLVPTMGALHDGHLSLVKRSKGAGRPHPGQHLRQPIQFDRADDFSRHPRTEAEDVTSLEPSGL